MTFLQFEGGHAQREAFSLREHRESLRLKLLGMVQQGEEVVTGQPGENHLHPASKEE